MDMDMDMDMDIRVAGAFFRFIMKNQWYTPMLVSWIHLRAVVLSLHFGLQIPKYSRPKNSGHELLFLNFFPRRRSPCRTARLVLPTNSAWEATKTIACLVSLGSNPRPGQRIALTAPWTTILMRGRVAIATTSEWPHDQRNKNHCKMI